jgi:excisionase family DNA binding protein
MSDYSKRFLSPAEVAKVLGVSSISVYRWTETGTLPSVKLGSRRLIPSEVVDSLVATAFNQVVES